MSSFWATSDGTDVRETVKDANSDLPSGGGDFAPLPDKTKVLATVESCGIKEKDGNRYAYAVLEIQKPEGYARRKLFPSFWIYDDNPHAADKDKKRSNDLTRFVKLDAACGGKLARKGGIPDGDDIALALTGKSVIAHVMLMKPKEGDPLNWLADYWPKGAKELSEAVEVKKPASRPIDDDLDESIPF